MITLTFLHPNVFNVVKYVVMSLTISLAADILVDAIYAYNTDRILVKRGWVEPDSSSIRLRCRRGVRFRKPTGRWVLFLTVAMAWILEIALEFSTSAESVWITSTHTFRLSNQATDVSELLSVGPSSLLKMRSALGRVERTCYDIQRMTYVPVWFNMTGTNQLTALGESAKCFQNFTEHVNATEAIKSSSFKASDVVAMNMWNESQVVVGKDVQNIEATFALSEVGDVRIGASEEYSFVAVNFSMSYFVRDGQRILTNKSEQEQPRIFWVGNYTTESGTTVECLSRMRWREDRDTGELSWNLVDTEVCLVPIADGRKVIALFDENVDGADGFQLLMSVAVEGVRSFFDLELLRMLPWMVGNNDGEYTFRELATLTVISGGMVQGIVVDGHRDVTMEVGDRQVTAPTVSVWGLALLVTSTIAIVAFKLLVGRQRQRMHISGNVSTARGVAEHWLERNEPLDDGGSEKDARRRVVLVLEKNFAGTKKNVLNVATRKSVEMVNEDASDP